MSNYDVLLDAYIKLFKERVALSERLIKPYLHVFLGQALCNYTRTDSNKKKEYYFRTSGYYSAIGETIVSNRINIFSYQSTGTGKGIVMKFNRTLFDAYGISSIYADSSVSSQWLKGGNDTQSKQTKWIDGTLQGYHCVMWSEGENIVQPNKQEYGDFGTTLRSVLDEPGEYSFGTRKDLNKDGTSPIFYTNASICSAAIINQTTLNNSILSNGTLQRFLLTYNLLSKEESAKLRDEIDNRDATTKYYNEKEEELKKFCDIAKGIITPLKNKNDHWNKIGFNLSIMKDYSRGRREIEDKILEQFPDGEKQNLMQGFFNRNIMYDKKIASQVAIINGCSEIGLDELKIGTEIAIKGMDAISSLFTKKYLPSLDKDDAVRLLIIYNAIELITQEGKVPTQSRLVFALLNLFKKDWDLGENRTKDFLTDLVAGKYLILKKGERNANIYQVPLTAANNPS